MGLVLCILGVLFAVEFASAQFQMPDPKQMSGIPRPVDDLPAGAVSVRLIRGDLSNNIANHPVELHVGDQVQTVNTDASGRAQFDKLPAGAALKAVAVVDGERLESQQFPAPGQGGIRLLLVATDKEKERKAAEEAKAPPVDGIVVLGGESRIVIEPGEDGSQIFYLLDISNNARAPVNPTTPFVFEMPKGATETTILQGSSSLARANGSTVSVAGPFPPGPTVVQVGASLPADGSTLEIRQIFPAAFEQPIVIVKKVGDLKLVSPQIDRQEEAPTRGETVIVGAGRTIAAGQPLTFTLTGLPHRSPAPRRTALTLALGIVIVGIWAAGRADDPAARTSERKRLLARREKLFQDLVKLEHDFRRGRLDQPRYAPRREEILTSLEHIYGALDSDDTGPEPADRTGLAA